MLHVGIQDDVALEGGFGTAVAVRDPLHFNSALDIVENTVLIKQFRSPYTLAKYNPCSQKQIAAGVLDALPLEARALPRDVISAQTSRWCVFRYKRMCTVPLTAEECVVAVAHSRNAHERAEGLVKFDIWTVGGDEQVGEGGVGRGLRRIRSDKA